MAVYPCDWSRHRYRQRQQSIYYTYVTGHTAQTYPMRLCPEHFLESLDLVQAAMAELDDSSAVSASCESCGGERAGSIYAKVFATGEERVEYAVDLCAACLSRVGNGLRIFNPEPMQAS